MLGSSESEPSRNYFCKLETHLAISFYLKTTILQQTKERKWANNANIR